MDEFARLVELYEGSLIAIQAPEGLKARALELSEQLEAEGVGTVLIGDPCFGSCHLADADAGTLGAAALIHLGHAPIPDAETDVPVHYIEYREEPDIVDAVAELTEILVSPVGLATTVQHVDMMADLKNGLEASGHTVHIGEAGGRVTYDGQVLGCDLSTVHAIEEDVATFLYLGTGRFHPLGIALATGRPVITLNPYTGGIDSLDNDQLLRQRYGAIGRAMDAKRIGILVAPRGGQQRFALAEKLKSEFVESGRVPVLISTDFVNPDFLMAFRLDALVVTSCPRIAFDDYERFEMPVLTATEARMLMKGADGLMGEEYVLDEFNE
jgi:2-(3-amino-3-carboxypropyl)histidine synthase